MPRRSTTSPARSTSCSARRCGQAVDGTLDRAELETFKLALDESRARLDRRRHELAGMAQRRTGGRRWMTLEARRWRRTAAGACAGFNGQTVSVPARGRLHLGRLVRGADAPQLAGTANSHSAVTTICPAPPISTAGTAPNSARHRAGAEIAEIVRGTGEHAVHRADPPPHLRRRAKLHQREADHDADHVGRAHDGQRRHRKPQLGREPKTRSPRRR